jgi:hypothetical protein
MHGYMQELDVFWLLLENESECKSLLAQLTASLPCFRISLDARGAEFSRECYFLRHKVWLFVHNDFV